MYDPEEGVITTLGARPSLLFHGFPHLTKVKQLPKQFIEGQLLDAVRNLRQDFFGGGFPLTDKRIAILFHGGESVKTMTCLHTAIANLGGTVLYKTGQAELFSTSVQGGDLNQLITMLCRQRPDAIILRHNEDKDAADKAVAISNKALPKRERPIPIISAGCGSLGGQHPLQSLADMLTILIRFGEMDGLSVAMVGDLNSRVVRSLAYLLGSYKRIKMYLVSSEASRMGTDLKEHLRDRGATLIETNNLPEIAHDVNVAYITKDPHAQFLKFGDGDRVVVNQEVMLKLRHDAIVMDPLPISMAQEIRSDVMDDPRVLCLRDQLDMYLYTIMALLSMVIPPNGRKRHPGN